MAMSDLGHLRDDVVEFVAGTLYLSHPGLFEHLGAADRADWRENLANLFDALRAALECHDSQQFIGYAIWLADALANRGHQPAGPLSAAFVLLADILARRLPGPEAAAAAAILADAGAAVGQPAAEPAYPECLPAPLAGADDYLRFALAGNQAAALAVVEHGLRDGLAYQDLGLRLLQPAMYRIGYLWQRNRISVAQEHLATAVSQNVLLRAYMQAEFAPANGRKALFACVQGNWHSLGLRMLSDSFEIAGWEIAYLGANVPTDDLIRYAANWRPDLLGLSISLPWQIPRAREAIARLRGELAGRAPFILVGGLTSNVSDRLWQSLGADGWAGHAADAVRVAGSS